MQVLLLMWFWFVQSSSSSDPGSPLLLTPLIHDGQIEKAQKAAEVNHPFMPIRSYSGFLTVNQAFDSNLFFWFFPSLNDSKTDPVLLWLQGGPGATSLFGLFTENGPFVITDANNLTNRAVNWALSHSLLYIDNPVGTGFSYTNGGFAQNETAVGDDLYEALLQFFQLFPDLQKNDFYISGESYAGKYIPAIGYTILKNNLNGKQKINLQGLTIGDGWNDPINQFLYADYWYQTGLIDFNTRDEVKRLEKLTVEYIKTGQWMKAYEMTVLVVGGNIKDQPSIFQNHTGFKYYYNILDATNSLGKENDKIKKFLGRSDVRKALHVGKTPFEFESATVLEHLKEDFMKSVAPWVSELLDHYPVMYYNGQLDPCVPYTATLKFLQNLKFTASAEYESAPRHIWKVKEDIAGYIKQAGNLIDVLVRNAGHMVPTDQPEWALDLITKFTHKQLF